jgi:hypothetical protein
VNFTPSKEKPVLNLDPMEYGWMHGCGIPKLGDFIRHARSSMVFLCLDFSTSLTVWKNFELAALKQIVGYVIILGHFHDTSL